jgi:hypothetical protein
VRSVDGTLVYSGAMVDQLSFCALNTSSQAFVSKVCDVRVAAGMPLFVFAWPDVNANKASLRNVRVHYKIVDSDAKTVVFEAPPVLEATALPLISRDDADDLNHKQE